MENAPNGQCFPTPSEQQSTPGIVGAFFTYNAVLESVRITGGPSTASIVTLASGSGFVFPSLRGGRCVFESSVGNSTQQHCGSSFSVATVLTVLSTTSAVCPSPQSNAPGTYTVSLLLNGLNAEPTLFGAPVFEGYDLSGVKVQRLEPRGGPAAASTAVTLHGSGFSAYGSGQLVCHIAPADGNSTNVPGVLLDKSRVRCGITTPAQPGDLKVRISLNGAAPGTLGANEMVFTVYAQPSLFDILPRKGAAVDGNLVTIFGAGFTAFSSDQAERVTVLRCKFGAEVSPRPWPSL
jgi:hypothetical protein